MGELTVLSCRKLPLALLPSPRALDSKGSVVKEEDAQYTWR